MSLTNIPKTTINTLIEKYDALLLDAYGVIVDKKKSLPGAKEFIDHLNNTKKPYLILTNGSSVSVKEASERYKTKNLKIPPQNIITSGSLIKIWIEQQKLTKSNCLVIGPKSSYPLVEEAGCQIIELEELEHKKDIIDMIIITDQTGFPFLDTVEKIISFLFESYDNNNKIKLLLPNPDLIFPFEQNSIKITSGSVALLIEHALMIRFPNKNIAFEKIGKPHPLIFQEAQKKYPDASLIMIGDQVCTDIKGAYDFGIDSALVNSGLSSLDHISSCENVTPNYIMDNIQLS